MFLMRSVLSLSAILAAQPAFACAVVLPRDYEGSARQVRSVRNAIDRASIIIDGEVIRPFVEGRHNALVRVERVLRGSTLATVEVGYADSCAIALDRTGERARMILSGGPDVYQLYRDQSEARIEDRVLRSDRRRVWPFRLGGR